MKFNSGNTRTKLMFVTVLVLDLQRGCHSQGCNVDRSGARREARDADHDIDGACVLKIYSAASFGGSSVDFTETTRPLPEDLNERSMRSIGSCQWRVLAKRECGGGGGKKRGAGFVLGAGSECESNSKWGLQPNCIAGVIRLEPGQSSSAGGEDAAA